MANDGNVQFHSADIGKKPQEQLLKNVTQKTAAQKFFSDRDKVKSLITGIIALLCVVMLGVVALVAYGPWKDGNGNGEPAWQEEVYVLQDEMAGINQETSGEDFFTALDRIDEAIEGAQNESMRFQLTLIRADVMIRSGIQPIIAVDTIIVPELDATTDDSRRFLLNRLAVQAFQSVDDEAEVRNYVERILALPDSAFPNEADDTWREFYVRLQKELNS